MAEMILVETHGRVGLVRLNRPQALNALCAQMMQELGEQLLAFDADPDIGAVILTGSDKAFAAGADIGEIQHLTFPDIARDDFVATWEIVTKLRKPVIAAVAGHVLGGGNELAMMCDIILAADSASFAQPEIQLGVIPGSGGTQRLTRAVGKAKAMDMILTGRRMSAEEAERSGLVSRIVPAAELLPEALRIAEKIAGFSSPALAFAKQAVNRAAETPQAEGIRFERALFYSLFGTRDQKEGMNAFIEKRKRAFRVD